MKIAYKKIRLSAGSLLIVKQANAILREYVERGIVVTLRQLYYQFVARDLIKNKQTEYKRLGSIINDARMAGLIDWDLLQDRTRNLERLNHWDTPGGVIESAAQSYHRDLWQDQPNYVEVWVEKDALLSVIERPCNTWDVPYFACRGYTSQSEMWSAGQRMLKHIRMGQKVKVIHLGDHDPSGCDMSRDIQERLLMFCRHHLMLDHLKNSARFVTEQDDAYYERIGASFDAEYEDVLTVNRVALNMDQIKEYNPPPNPAKFTDSRATNYVNEYGDESWELDALPPDVLVELIDTNVESYVDLSLWEEKKEQQEHERKILIKASDNWDGVAEYLEE